MTPQRAVPRRAGDGSDPDPRPLLLAALGDDRLVRVLLRLGPRVVGDLVDDLLEAGALGALDRKLLDDLGRPAQGRACLAGPEGLLAGLLPSGWTIEPVEGNGSGS